MKKDIQLKDGTTANDPRLDRLIDFDARSLNYPMRQLIRGLEPKTREWLGYTTDQKNQGSCTGHAVVQEVAARPNPQFGDPEIKPVALAFLNAEATQVYFRAQQLDPWPGGEYPGASPSYSGTSVLAAMKAGMEKGWWKEFRWALGPGAEAAAMDVIRTISHVGPVIVGSYWWSGMWRTDRDGYLLATGVREGGHAYLLTRYDAKRDAVWTPNSWGGYGAGWISRKDLVTLLGDDGEACIAIAKDMETPDPEPLPEYKPKAYKVIPPSRVYHDKRHLKKKPGKEVTDTEGLTACKTCKRVFGI